MPRGGKRQGAPGKAYAQRTDMNQNRQPIRVAAGQAYGERQAQEQAQRAVPLPAAPPVQVPPPSPAPGPAPGSFGAFNRPTERPDEPLTAGMPMGPGPGPEAVAGSFMLSGNDQLIAELRGLYATYPNPDVARLLAFAEQRQRTPLSDPQRMRP